MIRILCLALPLALGACAQAAYDQRATAECEDLLNTDERRACEAAADQARWERGAAKRAEAD